MTGKNKRSSPGEKPFRLTLQQIIRWLIFSFLVFFLINYLSQTTSKKIPESILGETAFPKDLIPLKLDAEKQELIESSFKEIAKISQPIKEFLGDFPQKQITHLKKEIVTQIYQKIVEEW